MPEDARKASTSAHAAVINVVKAVSPLNLIINYRAFSRCLDQDHFLRLLALYTLKSSQAKLSKELSLLVVLASSSHEYES